MNFLILDQDFTSIKAGIPSGTDLIIYIFVVGLSGISVPWWSCYENQGSQSLRNCFMLPKLTQDWLVNLDTK